MKNDPIVEEVRKVRDDHAKQFDYDLDAIVADIKHREAQNKDRLVRLEPRPSEKKSRSEKPAA